ncbi:type II restriction endonuclease [Edaphobacter albus]|uniref:type II restriction endonuclease n=1 Tax=Edaphobacter sp. 4G125 TaxID=2763071 RepID=UPI001646BAC8|nr:type II restriction endonuclease [Edaphobacter sp. 4G125]QNI35869.1 restriction endonuclease [Edaphobacter sp. 4G125]
MRAGYLSEFFSGVAIKRLSAVEADLVRSHQHEFNGDKGLIRVLGRTEVKRYFDALWVYLSDSDDEPIVARCTLTWYDARVDRRPRTEHRFYFPTNPVSIVAAEGDLLVVARRPDDSVLIIIAQGGSTIASQVQWLFGVAVQHKGFSVREELETEQDRIQFASAFILEQLGIDADAPAAAENYLDAMLARFNGQLPPTAAFSAYARETLPDLDPMADPDGALLGWMEREEILFRTMEKHILGDRLQKGFADDVDGFLAFSLAVQNRRKSRSGRALENHLQVIFDANRIRYQRGALTEAKQKPDFLFPGGKEYADLSFEATLLTMLGAKTTCKDRWRQVLAEAKRIDHKHLLTLEAAISVAQTDQMKEYKLQLVLPRGLHGTFTAPQQRELMTLANFTAMVKQREAASTTR